MLFYHLILNTGYNHYKLLNYFFQKQVSRQYKINELWSPSGNYTRNPDFCINATGP